MLYVSSISPPCFSFPPLYSLSRRLIWTLSRGETDRIESLQQVNWSKTRFDAICAQLLPFLTQSGFHPSKVFFVPVGATTGVNLVEKVEGEEGLGAWYDGKTLVEQLGQFYFSFPSSPSLPHFTLSYIEC
jgi:hypothetical protein